MQMNRRQGYADSIYETKQDDWENITIYRVDFDYGNDDHSFPVDDFRIHKK